VGGSWNKFGDRKALSLSADYEGTPWIVEHSNQKQIFKWQNSAWLRVGYLRGANYIATGRNAFALARPMVGKDHTIYKLVSGDWVALPSHTAEEIAVG